MQPHEAYYAAREFLAKGDTAKARELLPLMLASDRAFITPKIEAVEAKRAAS